MRILILGVTGMLGNVMLRVLSGQQMHHVYGTSRNVSVLHSFKETAQQHLLSGVDVENYDSLVSAFAIARPQLVVNCIGLVKQLADANNPLHALPINALLPHRLAALCAAVNARLIHISTDCVFSGHKGNYLESDFPDADDLYGRSKLLGEVDYPYAVTLRTSIIGHELAGNRSLICWFLSQQNKVKGFTNAIFSGLPTVELSYLIRDYVIPNESLHGLYHVSAEPINKFDLLNLVASVYDKTIEIVPDDSLVVDRSLDSTRFRTATGYRPPPWPELVRRMREFR
jgi:dTDP-4-dehydrorhamnose reductase